MSILDPPDTMRGGPSVPEWLDRKGHWHAEPPEDAEEDEEVCTQSSFILFRSTTSESSGELFSQTNSGYGHRLPTRSVFLSLCSLILCVPPLSLPLVRAANPLPFRLVPPPLLNFSLSLIKLSPSQFHSFEEVACRLGSLLPPAVGVSVTPAHINE